MTDLSALREAEAKMSPGPWRFHVTPDGHTISDYSGNLVVREAGDYEASTLDKDDAAGVVALRNAAPALLDELEAAAAVLEGAEPATWMASADGTMLVRVPVDAWEAWQARGKG